ncbi:MAG: cation transporter [Saprospiraceae bacterium]|nr:cation transporter [Saprospiraceae bacterium]
MNRIYSIKGMTCKNCVTQVQKALLAIQEVIEATIDLEKEEVKVVLSKNIPIEALQKRLPSKYTILQRQKSASFEESNDIPSTSKLSQLKPLFLILGYIFSTSILLHIESFNVEEMMIDFMGIFFIVFSFFKLLDLKGFSISFSMYDPLAKFIPSYATVYPFIEVVLGLLFLFRWNILVALFVTIIVLSVTTFGVAQILLSKRKIKCACLGTVLQLPMTEATLIENILMIGMALLLLL